MMFKYVYIGIFLWVFLPLLFFFLLPSIGILLRSKRIQIAIRNIMRICLGLPKGQKCNKSILYQFGKLECGEIALKNAISLLGKEGSFSFCLPENSSMKDLHDAAIRCGYSAKGIKETSLESVELKLRDSNIKILTLIKVYYPFNGFWVYPTRIFMKLMTSNVDALHWVVIEEVGKTDVEIIDPYFGFIKISRNNFEDIWNRIIITIQEERR